MLPLVAVFGEVPFVSAGATQIVFGAGQFFEEFVFEMAEGLTPCFIILNILLFPYK